MDSSSLADLFELLRSTHSLHTLSGGTPATYEVLVRGYANLGALTSHTWNAAYKVYQARSLLYAQRFVRTHPESARAYFLRAYAFGMCGLHSLALDDLATGRTLANSPEPEWVSLLDNFVHFRTEKLVAAANGVGPCSYIAGVMALMTQEYTPWSSRVFQTYVALKTKPPVDFRTLAQLNDAGGVSSLHKTTIDGFNQMSYLIKRELPQHALCPEIAKEALSAAPTNNFLLNFLTACGLQAGQWPELARIPDLYLTLRKETSDGQDLGEPSLATFGDLLRENMLVIAAWRQHFMNNIWSVDIDDFTREVLPYIAGHRYENLLAAYSAKRHQNTREYHALLEKVHPADLPAGGYLFVTKFCDEQATYGVVKGSDLRARFLEDLDQTYCDQQRLLSMTEGDEKKNLVADQVLKASPQSPFGRRIKLTYVRDWESLYKQYEQEGVLCPEVAQIVAWHYERDGKFAEAIPYYKQVIEQVDESYIYNSLATCYQRIGDDAAWLETMERALALPDYGLSHATIRCNIAKQLMTKGDIKRARTYAETAAESYSQWALSLAGECAIADGDKQRAVELLVAEKERYEKNPGAPNKAYFKALVYQMPATNKWFQALEAEIPESLNKINRTLAENVFQGFYHWRQGDFDQASERFNDAFLEAPDVWYSILEALVLLEKGDQEKYMKKLVQIIDEFESTDTSSSSRKQIRKLAILMKEYAEGKHAAETLQEKLLALKKDGSLYAADFYFFTGKYLSIVGQDPGAIQLFYEGIVPGQLDRWAGPFCYLELQNRGLNPFARYTKQSPKKIDN